MSQKKKEVRADFRKAVFERDCYCCRYCGKPGVDRQISETEGDALDAHHICPRTLMPNGGYVAENGISLCSECHILAEDALNTTEIQEFQPERLYELIGSSFEIAYEASQRLTESR